MEKLTGAKLAPVRIIDIYTSLKYTLTGGLMEFIETPVFSKIVNEILSDYEYRQLQTMLLMYPDAGEVIPASGGLRKLRWASCGKGKRGGIRIIYYWYSRDDQMFFLYAYKKSNRSDLTKKEIKILRRLIEGES